MTNGLVVLVDHEHWCLYFPHLSDDARVVTLYLPYQSGPLDVDLKVQDFQWPRPSDNTQISVQEPDRAGFKQRLEEAGVAVPSFDDYELEGISELLVEEDEDESGATVSVTCPICQSVEMHVMSNPDIIALSKDYAKKTGRKWFIMPRQSRPRVDGKLLWAVRCPECLATFLRGPAFEGLCHHSLEVG